MNAEQKVASVKCKKSLLFHTRYFYKKLKGKKFTVSSHHNRISDPLELVLQGKLRRIMFNVAPRYGKTELVIKSFMSHGLALNPSSKFIHLSYSNTLALDNSEEVKEVVVSEEYQALFPDVKLKKGTTAKEKWYTDKGGGVLARAAGGQVTGFGAGEPDFDENFENDLDEFISGFDQKLLFSGAILIDDPVKPDDASSETIRTKINERFDTTIRSRVNSRKTPIIIVMQRLHELDLCGHLMEQDGYTTDLNEALSNPDLWYVVSLPVIEMVDGKRKALWEAKHTLEELDKLRQKNEFVFDTQYMQDPTPKEGLLFPKTELNYFRKSDVDLSKADASLSFVDVADTGEDNHSVPFGKLMDKRIYIDDVIFTKEPTETNVPITVSKANEHKPQFMQVESNFGGTMYIQLMRLQSLNGTTALIPKRAKGNKHTRIITASGFIKTHCYFLHESEYDQGSEYDLFMKNLTKYMKKAGAVKHDDAPDSMSGLAKMIISYYPHLFEGVIIQD